MSRENRLQTIRRYSSYGLWGGIFVGIIAGMLIGGPHFREWQIPIITWGFSLPVAPPWEHSSVGSISPYWEAGSVGAITKEAIVVPIPVMVTEAMAATEAGIEYCV